jgi:hypothetical protein
VVKYWCLSFRPLLFFSIITLWRLHILTQFVRLFVLDNSSSLIVPSRFFFFYFVMAHFLPLILVRLLFKTNMIYVRFDQCFFSFFVFFFLFCFFWKKKINCID